MNLNDQIDSLAVGVDRLIDIARAAQRAAQTAANEQGGTETAAHAEPAAQMRAEAVEAAAAPAETAAAQRDAADTVHATALEPAAPEPAVPETPPAPPSLTVARPEQNEITLTIGGQTVSLHPHQVSQLIEELAVARASMSVEQPAALPQGWRFVATKNPALAVQKHASGDRLLVLRHTGYGWVPFTFSPESAIQLYMLLTQQ